MLLDLWPLFQGLVTPPVRGGYEPSRTRRTVLPKPVQVHQDLGILVQPGQAVLGIWGGRRIQARQGQLDDDGADLVAVEDFRPAARWADDGVIAAARMDLAGADEFQSGASAIAAADDELLQSGDF